MAETITVLTPGLSAIQDLGRRRGSRVGQMTGGALDQYSARAANILVAADTDSPLIELTALDFAAVAGTDMLVAVTGAPAQVRIDGAVACQWDPLVWPAGSTLTVTNIRDGLRVYLAVHGTVHTNRLEQSCAPDTVLGFGRTLARGDRIQVDVDCPPIRHPHFDIPVFRLGVKRPDRGDRRSIPVTDGPDVADFGDSAGRLLDTEFTVGNASNHIGLRLAPTDDAPLPHRVIASEMLSRGVPIGAVEVPAGKELLVLHRGRGVTAGYPVLAVVTTIGLDRLGQARPGDRIRFTRVSVAGAVDAHRARQRSLDRLRTRVRTVFAELGIPNHTRPDPPTRTDTRPFPAPSSALTLESA
ncbi:allophanate hydrolase [Rhodococcus sp. IEGM 1381]|uniref:5-oxoprolinase subunit C family protein n=1 Tax=Rhodococcus sp. IEGM 1381 TaxID=3047085 RepID=UPI0024B78BAC|nr:allophanate hydrolase [Rhodococcus sp. IEGM 1381]MDI9897142.1 allophanate hydrolase [Rhodococcus sp. IEGM 1381]